MNEESKENPADLDIKVAWEIRKLQAEVEALRRPLRNPSVIAALMTASLITFVSLGGLALQWSRSDREYTLAQIKTERLELDGALLRKQKEALDREIAARNSDLARIRREVAEATDILRTNTAGPAEIAMTHSRLQRAAVSLESAAKPLALVSGSIGASPGTIAPGETARLSWNSFNATDIVISPDIGYVSPSGTADVAPKVTTTYTLKLSNLTGSSGSADVTVQVIGPKAVSPR